MEKSFPFLETREVYQTTKGFMASYRHDRLCGLDFQVELGQDSVPAERKGK